MIYVSSSCVKNTSIKDSVKELAEFGFKNIELSGGTKFYDYGSIVNDLLKLKADYNLNYLLHNYFPPPKKDFVLNLASLNKEINQQSYNHVIESIDMSLKIGAKQFGFHAGFFLDINTNEIGKKITSKPYTKDQQKEAKELFYKNYNKILSYAKQQEIEIFIENNVYSASNYKTFGDYNPLMMLSKNDFNELNSKIDFNLLLDFAHLKVSCNTLNLNFEQESKALISKAKYIHISDNNALEDTNRAINSKSDTFQLLKNLDLKNKIITLEIYENLEAIKASYKLIESLL